jgi:hypothetical protein
MRRPSPTRPLAASLLVACTSACFLFGPKTKAPEREYTPAEQELRADYQRAKASNDRELSACIWDYSKLVERLAAGPKAHTDNNPYQSDLHCRAALEHGSAHPDLANEYVAKFAALEESRAALIAESKEIKNEADMDQCLAEVRRFEDERDGIDTAAFLVRCSERFERLPEPERADLPGIQASLDELRTRHAELLTNFERLKQDAEFTRLVDDHLRLQDEAAMLELRLHEIEQLSNSPEAATARSTTTARLRLVQDQMKANLAEREPFYVEYGVVLQ